MLSSTEEEKSIQQVIQASLVDSKPTGISIENNAQPPASAQSITNGRMEDDIFLDLIREEDDSMIDEVVRRPLED
jgi:hypothetical protein